MPGPDGHRPRSSLPLWSSATLRAAFTERLGYKGAALFFALVLWVIARAEEPVEQIVPVRVEVVYDTMRAPAGRTPPVRALVVGRARELIKLYSEAPVIRRAIAADAPDTVRLDLRPADIFLPTGIEAQIRDVQPRVLELPFDVRMSRRVPVMNATTVMSDSGVREREVRVEPESVIVTGQRDAVRRIQHVATEARTVTVGDSAVMVPLDLASLAGVTVRPDQVRMSVPPRLRPGDTARREPRRVSAVPPR
jgi:hypothetical protein